MRTVQELRELLVGVRWRDFEPVSDNGAVDPAIRFNKASRCVKKRIVFYAKYGMHMQRPVITITAQGHLVHFVRVQPCPIRGVGTPIIAEKPHSQHGDGPRQYLFTSDFEGDRYALTTLKGSTLSIDDLVLGWSNED
jgi:hypothetical protein